MANSVFSFFSGAGFLDLGFESAGFDVAFVNEYYPPFLEAYKSARKKMDMSEPAYGHSVLGIEEFLKSPVSSQKLQAHVKDARLKNRTIGFIGGPPCPDFSLAGKHKGFLGENGKLTRVYFDLIIKQKPDWFLFENVKGFFHTKKHREFFNKLLLDLQNAGYAVSYNILNALEFGVPQYRDRVVIFGVLKKYAQSDFLVSGIDDVEHYVRYSELKSFKIRKYAKYTLEEIQNYKWPTKDIFKQDGKLRKPTNLPWELTVEHWFRENKVAKHANAAHHFKPTKGNRRFSTIEEGCANGKSYKRLHRWRYSPTAAYGNNEVHLHPYKPRRLSAAEALAIQSMPKEFELPADMALSAMFKTIGNGVPFLMAHGIAKTIKDYLGFLEASAKVNTRKRKAL